MFHSSNISELQENSWANFYAWCVWKTSLSNNSNEYKTTVRLSEILLENNIWIVHWWYEDGKWGGTMQAYAEWANNIIRKNNLSKYYNIWIPEDRFDRKRWVQDRTKFDTQFTDPLLHMDIRCGVLIDACDLLVVNQLAWNWTLREVFTMYERNDIHRPWNLWKGKISPIVFYWENWKNLFDVLNNEFVTWIKVNEDKNLFFVNSIPEFEKTIRDIKNILNK